jgi:nicotinamidase-related amidase
MEPVVIVVDLAEDFFQRGRLLQHREGLVERTNDLTSSARQRDIPVIWVRPEFMPDLSDAFLVMRKRKISVAIAGTSGSQLLEGLSQDEADYEIIKKRYSAFFRTELDDLLGQLRADTLVVAGVNTHACVRTTVIDAYQRDYEVIIAVECVDSYDEEHHRISLRYLTEAMAVGSANQELFARLG